jgi:hypothetical protein
MPNGYCLGREAYIAFINKFKAKIIYYDIFQFVFVCIIKDNDSPFRKFKNETIHEHI